jgi:FtsP/CotA-like multicopper oxidase with cupredoxin domain
MQPKEIFYELTASRFEWQISEDKTVEAWGFNQQVPGPTIKATKGDTLVIKVKNELHKPTIIHWHGVRLPAAMDGTGEAQRPIQPGEEFEYRFTVPDAGTFWYHSHHDETIQMERGMYGALIVEENTELVMDNDRVFMIDDMKLNEKNEFKREKFFGRWKERHDGREGDTLLINGKEAPYIHMHAGQTERWRFINASSARYFMLNMEGRTFGIIGTDGGLIEKLVEATQILITPGERVELVVGPFNEGDSFAIESLPYNRMTFKKSKQEVFAQVIVGKEKDSMAAIPLQLRKIESLTTVDSPINRSVKLSVGPSIKNGIDFLVNGDMHSNDKPVNVGELQVWEVSNTSLMDHPFHLHGFFFQVLERNGVGPEFISWKDTINLPPRSKAKIAWIPDNRPGMWMYHCHILEHHAAGMMANFEVVDPAVGERHKGQHCHH